MGLPGPGEPRMALGCFSTFAVQFLPADLLGGTGKLKFQKAAQVASVAIGLAAGTKPVVLQRLYHIRKGRSGNIAPFISTQA